MSYEWDPKKAKSNYKKHGVKFSDAVGVFEDENAITIEDNMKVKTVSSRWAEISFEGFWSWFTRFAV